MNTMFNLYRLDPKGLNDPEGNKSVPKDLIWVGYDHKHPDGTVEPILSPWMDIVLAGSTKTLQAYVDRLLDDRKYKSAPVRRLAVTHLATLLEHNKADLCNFATQLKQELLDNGVSINN